MVGEKYLLLSSNYTQYILKSTTGYVSQGFLQSPAPDNLSATKRLYLIYSKKGIPSPPQYAAGKSWQGQKTRHLTVPLFVYVYGLLSTECEISYIFSYVHIISLWIKNDKLYR